MDKNNKVIETKQTRNMKKWFKKMYYDKDYATIIQDETNGYATVLRQSPDWGTEYTGRQEIGNHKKTTIEALEKELELVKTKLELAQKMKTGEEVDELNRAEQGENTGGNA